MKNYIAYYRVSTTKQGISGLGLESQEDIVKRYVEKDNGIILKEFTEVESGRKNQRPKLEEAVAECKRSNAILVVAKLDRLYRDVYFTSQLLKEKLDFICCDFPQANKLTIHILSAISEYEVDLIRARTKAALSVLKDRGVKLGSPQNFTDKGRRKGSERRRLNASLNENSIRAKGYANTLYKGGKSLREIAYTLNEQGFKSPKGKTFKETTVRRLLD